MNTKSMVLQTNDKDSIIALCTPRGSGAIAVLRLSGDNVVQVADEISKLSSKKKLKDSQTHTIHHGHVISSKNNEIIDEVLFFLMHAPKTFTGQDTVEISCHNNPFIIERIIEQAILEGARLADRGEFTKRAFLNKKIDFVQAESINEIINAQTELALKKSMSQLQGSLSNYLSLLEYDLIGLLSLVENSFEFMQEEQQDLNIEKLVKEKTIQIESKLKEIKLNFSQQQQIKDGIRICLLGCVNTGKSTLFNALLKKDRAIVTEIEGTTRDSVESSIYRNGNFWLFVDTAGLRKTKDFIEQQGIKRSMQQAAGADIILLIFDLSVVLFDQQLKAYKDIFEKYKDKIILVANKADIEIKESLEQLNFICSYPSTGSGRTDFFEISAARGDHSISSWLKVPEVLNEWACPEHRRGIEPYELKKFIKVSATKKERIRLLECEIENKVQEIFSKLQSPFLLNQRQYNLILELEKKLEFIVKNYINPIQYELMAYHIKQILEKLSELTGKNVTEKVLDRVFSDFCVGK